MEVLFPTTEKILNPDETLKEINTFIEQAKIIIDVKQRIMTRMNAIALFNKLHNSIEYNNDLYHNYAALLYEILLDLNVKIPAMYEKCLTLFVEILKHEFIDPRSCSSIDIVVTNISPYIDIDTNIKMFTCILEVCPEYNKLNINMADLLQKKREYTKALSYAKLALQLNTTNPNKKMLDIQICNIVYNITLTMWKSDWGLRFIKPIYDLYPTDPNLNMFMGVFLTELKDKSIPDKYFKLAIEHIDETINNNRQDLLAMIYSNYAYYFARKPDQYQEQKYIKLSYETKQTAEMLRSVLMQMMYVVPTDKMAIANEHKKINQYYPRCEPYVFDKAFFETDKINIGIISGDLIAGHACHYFIKTFLNGYNKDMFTLTCYSDRKDVPNCKLLVGLTAKEGSDLVYSDKIHILIDLSGHTMYSRLDIFANKPSPIQISWIGYPFTTGLNEMDYRITDSICDSEESQQYYSEKLLFLKDSFLCFEPLCKPEIKAKSTQQFVIGSFNRPNKMSDEFIEMCNQILDAHEDVVLKFNSEALNDPEVYSVFISKFRHTDRISNIVSPRSLEHHMMTYNEVDICLDTFPYSGTTTTCECLTMGTPVLTIYNKDNFHVSNVSASLLINSDLNEYVCSDVQDVIHKIGILKTQSINKEEVRHKFLTGKVCDKDAHLINLQRLFVDLIRTYKPISYSQLGQDLQVLKFYNNKRNGFFIEIGANDGITLSNTYLLETQYEWNGICIEPLPTHFKKLCKARQNSLCVNKAIFNKSGEIVKFSVSNLLSGITSHIDKYDFVKQEEQIDVETITMDDLLDELNAPKFIEYMSLDTEGTEFEILKTIDYSKYIFGIIHLEHNYVEPKRTMIREFLKSNGYVYVGENKWDDEYMHHSLVKREMICSYDDINSLIIKDEIVFYDIYHKNNQLILICPVKDSIQAATKLELLKIYHKDIQLEFDGYILKSDEEPIFIAGYKFVSDNAKNDITVNYGQISKTFTLIQNQSVTDLKLSLTAQIHDDFNLFDMFYTYYIKQGVQSFNVYHNGQIQDILVPGTTFIKWNFKSTSAQMQHSLWKYGKNKTEYMIFCDLDEYLQVQDKTIIEEITETNNQIYGFCNTWCRTETIPEVFPNLFEILSRSNYGTRSKNIYKVSDVNVIGIHTPYLTGDQTLTGKFDYTMYHFLNWSNPSRTEEPGDINIVNV